MQKLRTAGCLGEMAIFMGSLLMSPGTPWNSQIVESLLTQKKIHWSHLKPRNAQVVAHSWKNKACGKNRVQLVNTCSGHLWSLEYPKTASPMFSYTVAYISYCFHISTRLLVWQIFSLRMHWVMSHTSVPRQFCWACGGPFVDCNKEAAIMW